MAIGTSILRDDHESILRMLDVMEEVAHRLNQGTSVPPETLTSIQEYLQVFADRGHHGKEEDLLFPLLESKGIPRRGGPIGVMLEEHDLGRGFIRQMVEASGQYAAGAAGSGSRWATAGREYAMLLRGHIDKENNILFTMAERILSAAEQNQLSGAFEKIETERLGPGTRDRLQASLEKLAGGILAR
jgi:hemerythrin-like domain-containing protein